MKIVSPEMNDYIASLLPDREAVVLEMEERAREEKFPIVGPQVGRLFALLAMIERTERVFEMGSGFGYSAYWFCRGMGPGGEVHCTDGKQANADRAMASFRRLGWEDRLHFHVGDACRLLAAAEGTFDIILIDIDKWQYPEAFDVAVPKLRSGGLLVADNLLRHGDVVRADPDRDTAGIQEYNRKAMSHPDLWTVILPLRDGVGISRKT